ncbi:HAD-IIIC family phosphatase [Janibacter sp. DB-40]|uniref:HAD-IIIC family phosphatase n=1 Tax=Janibacter sp. DB-40 TaxID=3028808 RepID=UPI0024072DB8|nr:HAD-IIIC family phosphatase [Janibacter sp. DB-40]
MVKLIVWDLDDTLWRGTLAEGDDIALFESRAQAIRQLNEQGVVHAICSKNDHAAAMEQLDRLGMRDQFVFNEIEFSPKGPMVRRIVEDMNLRFPDVVFADDNEVNLREVQHACEGIVTIDSRGDALDTFLARSIDETSGGKSRLAQYRIMEKKRSDRADVAGSNEDFLRTCNIKMAVLERTDNLAHAQRIEELINRTNQLNFLKTRVEVGSMAETIVESTKNFTFSAFVWDDYGNYGLVGFASVAFRRRLDHFTFSCRTMNMGIESALASIMQKTTLLDDSDLPVSPVVPDWISVVDPNSVEARERVAAMVAEVPADAGLRVMANCQSGSIAHYLKSPTAVDFDNWPRVFSLQRFKSDGYFPGEWRPLMVYGAFVDYNANYWPGAVEPTVTAYQEAADALVDACRENGSSLTVLLPTEKFDVEKPEEGLTRRGYAERNGVWREIARENAHVQVVEIDDVLGGRTISDPRHFDRDVLTGISNALVDACPELQG